MKSETEVKELYDYLRNTRKEMDLDNNALLSMMEIEGQIGILAWVLDIKCSDISTSKKIGKNKRGKRDI